MFVLASTDHLLLRRRLMLAGAAVAATLLFVCLLAPVVQALRPDGLSSIPAWNDNPHPSSMDSANLITGGFSEVTADAGHIVSVGGAHMMRGTMSVATAVTNFDKAVIGGTQDAAVATARGVVTGLAAIDSGVNDVVGGGFGFAGRVVGGAFGGAYKISHLSAVIQPEDTTIPPVIAQQRADQAALIQKDTTEVAVAPAAAVLARSDVGGACDNGGGNGLYPADWCNAPMDTIATVGYSSDRINRECTSYAYWYFSVVEGHGDLRVTGDAKRWAATSNYPVHAVPAVGAIAVETGGSYGHVAIVQALPGQTFAGKVVPEGFVLVSEMNYDWQGHFRYSYSPLHKFSAFIYR